MIKLHTPMVRPSQDGGQSRIVAPLGSMQEPRGVGPFAVVSHQASPEHDPGALVVDADVRPHPHIGLVALTWMIAGHVTHRDDLGNRCELGPGDVGCTVAGRGVVHSERFERLRLLGGRVELFQLLLALPDGLEDIEPSFRCLRAAEIPVHEGEGWVARWLAHPEGEPGGVPLPMPALLVEVALRPGARWTPPEAEQRAAYVHTGEASCGGVTARAGTVLVLPPGAPELTAPTGATVVLFGGPPVGPRYAWWNYLHSSLERIEAARAAWREGRAPLPPGDTESFTPAPPDHGRPLLRLNAPAP